MTRDCEYCQGTGVVPQTATNYVKDVNPNNRSSYPCRNCAGRGKYEVPSWSPAQRFSMERAETFAKSLLQYYPDRVDSSDVTNLALAFLQERNQDAHQ